jgi:acyl-CoA thioesterase-1
MGGRTIRPLLVVALLLAIAAGTEKAAAVNIVALGASNTAGLGVGRSVAWPTKLQAMLRAQGYHANVLNVGVSGITTERLLAGLGSEVPRGTQIVILLVHGLNDRFHGISREEHEANVESIVNRLRARGIRVIIANDLIRGLPRQGDGMHLSPEGHAMFAERVLPQVVQAMGQPRGGFAAPAPLEGRPQY